MNKLKMNSYLTVKNLTSLHRQLQEHGRLTERPILSAVILRGIRISMKSLNALQLSKYIKSEVTNEN